MARLATVDDVLKARGLSDSMPDLHRVTSSVLDMVTPSAENYLGTKLERYSRTDLWDYRPSSFENQAARSRPISFLLEQGFVDADEPFALYYAIDDTIPIKYAVPSVRDVALTSIAGAFDGTMVLHHDATVDQEWFLTFISETEFEAEGLTLGPISGGPFDIADAFSPDNDESTGPYFTILSTAWSGDFAIGETLSFATVAADTRVMPVRDYDVDYERGLVHVTRWGPKGTRAYAATYTAGYRDDGDCMIGVPQWLKSGAVSMAVRYLNAHTSKWNAKKVVDVSAQYSQIAGHIGYALNAYIRPRMGMNFPVRSDSVFLGFSE